MRYLLTTTRKVILRISFQLQKQVLSKDKSRDINQLLEEVNYDSMMNHVK